jgi:membrane protein insertase Oxa1/YidC/SpoIIIJ
LKEAGSGEQADTSEINAAMGRNFAYFMPFLIFILTIGFPAALALYWFIGGLIAYAQQSYLLQQDEYMMEQASAVVVRKKSLKPETPEEQTPPKKNKTAASKAKRRK